MSKTTTATISWQTIGDELTGTVPAAVQIINANSPGEALRVAIATGRNQVFLPGPPTLGMVVVIPPSTSVLAKTWDSASATGGAIGTNTASLISLPSGATTFYIGITGGSEAVTIYAL